MTQKQVFDVAYQPQVKTCRDTRAMMLDVIIALIPASAFAVIRFGIHVLFVILASVASAVFFEWAYRKLMKKDNRIGDFSAAITGLLLALVLPPQTPWWIPVIGSFFAIVVVKQLYGGIGKNFLNPALAGRAFLLASYAGILGSVSIDGVTTATPLGYMYAGRELPYTLKEMFMGSIPGAVGEVSAVAVIIGGAYLLVRGVISWRIPASFLGTAAIISLISGHTGYDSSFEWMLLNLTSGGIMLGAFFMATDYATSPVTGGGQLLYGFGCGALTMLIRYFGGYPEGVTYAILIMNLCSWAIDKAFKRKQFGAE